MTGPLAPQFAKVREALPLMFARTREERAEAFDEIAGALSAIERHVQDMENAARDVVMVEHMSGASDDQNCELRRRADALRAALSALDGEEGEA